MNAIVIEMVSAPRYGSLLAADLMERGICAVIFPGTDGRLGRCGIRINRKAFAASYRRAPLTGEIGCYETHVRIASSAISGSIPSMDDGGDWWLVLEDDAQPIGNMGAEKLRVIALAAASRGLDAVLLHSGRKCHRRRHPFRVGAMRRRDEFGTFAYLASRRAMEAVSGFIMRHPIDHAMIRCKSIRWGVLWGGDCFSHRAPVRKIRSIHWERKSL